MLKQFSPTFLRSAMAAVSLLLVALRDDGKWALDACFSKAGR